MNRAFSSIEFKSIDDDRRTFEGIASTPATDRMDDIVEPLGARFKLPLSFLYQHDSKRPIGNITHATATADGIRVRGYIEKLDGPPSLKERLDVAWAEIKAKLVRGLSIGFRGLEEEPIKGTYGTRYKSWEWLELSAVTIPAHQDACFTTIKALDHDFLAASGKEKAAVVRLGKSPGASGTSIKTPKGIPMKTTAEIIAGFEQKRAAVVGSMTTIMEKSAEDGATLDDEQTTQYDDAATELKTIDAHLERLRKHEQIMLTKATAITHENTRDETTASNTRSSIISVKDNLEPGIKFTRYVKCLAMANGNRMEALEISKGLYPDMPALHTILKTAVSAGTTQGTTWAKPLVEYQTYAGDFLEFLRPATVIGKFGTGNIPNLQRVPFNVHIKGQTSGGDAYWTGEGQAKQLTSFDFQDIYIGFTKLANIAVVTEELLRYSSPAAEGIIRKALADALIARMDTDFIDPAKAAVANVSPASITNGVTPITASGGTIEALRTDISALWSAWLTNNLGTANAVYIADAITALQIGTLRNAFGQPEFPGLGINGGMLDGVPVIVTQHVPRVTAGGKLILVNASEIYLADDGDVSIDISREASLQMDNAATNNSVTPTATTLVSLWQSNSVGVRAERAVGWQKRRASAVQFITSTAYDGT